MIVRQDGTGARQITSETDKVVDVALSGNGNILFVVTEPSRIMRFDLRTRVSKDVIPAVTLLRLEPVPPIFYNTTTGGLLEFAARTLPEIAEVRLQGKRQAILRQENNDLLAQAQYDLDVNTGWVELVLREQTDSPFASSAIWPYPISVSKYAPGWYGAGGYLAALHGDFSGIIQPSNPARPGEIIHAYGYGFGAVTPQPEIGAGAAADPLSRVAEPMVCELENSRTQPVEVLFAGLAPGFIGLYQFDVRLPSELRNEQTNLSCRRASNVPAGVRAVAPLPTQSAP